MFVNLKQDFIKEAANNRINLWCLPVNLSGHNPFIRPNNCFTIIFKICKCTAMSFLDHSLLESRLYSKLDDLALFKIQNKIKTYHPEQISAVYNTFSSGKFGGLMTKRLIFYFLISQSFYSVGMDKEDSYHYPQHQEEPQNFMTTLLNNPMERSELQNHCDSTHLKEQQIACEEEVEQEENSSIYRDILNKQLSNNLLPENFFQEPREQSILLITPQSKKTLPEQQNSSNKNLRVDKQLYHQESRKTKIERYLDKKPRRIWGKKVSYVCRKQVADNRQRKNGRFIKKSPVLQEKCISVFPSGDLFQMFEENHSNQSQRSIKSEFALQ